MQRGSRSEEERTDVDTIVVGGGAVGTAAAYALASGGRGTLLLERFRIGHDRGSSGGPTRVFRLSHDAPDDVRLARLALERWRALEDAAGETLLVTTGGIDAGEGAALSAEALRAAGEPVERLTPGDVADRWPPIRFPAGIEIFAQGSGGVCLASRTVLAQARLAASRGAMVLEDARVERIDRAGDGVEVRLAGGDVHRASVVIVSAGPWARTVLLTSGIDLPLVPSLEQVTYFARDPSPALPTIIDRVPDPAHPRYWVPDPTEPGAFKIGFHRSGPDVDPDARAFEPDPVRETATVRYVGERVDGAHALGRTETCLYTNTPDEVFVLDRRGPVVIGSPCSGYGFKFVPLIGELLAQLATGEPPSTDLSRFSASRPALRN